jgi:N-acetylglutamate synthase
MDLTLVEGIEQRLINAWPALQTVLVEDWVLRFADGYSKRANSATPIRKGATWSPAIEKSVRKLYGQNALDEVVRLTPLVDADAEKCLADAGFVDADPTYQMMGRLPSPGPIDPSIIMETAPSVAWIEGAARDYGGDKADASKLGAIVRLIRQPAIFATLTENGKALAHGLCVRERGMVGLFDIVVAPEARGKGQGRRMVEALLRQAAREGADRAYLQVRITNEPAIRLYQSLGMAPLYLYRHRIRHALPFA